jgi:hypothetical protein
MPDLEWINKMLWKINAFLNEKCPRLLSLLEHFSFVEWLIILLTVLFVVFK